MIKKVKDRARLLEMNDDLSELMYAETDEIMWARWESFKTKYGSDQEDYVEYFENTWMGKSGKFYSFSLKEHAMLVVVFSMHHGNSFTMYSE